MAMYCIGDIQGCAAALDRLLVEIDFSPSKDTLYVLGDLINRGSDSAGVIRTLMGLEGSAFCLLGNHDIHALAVYAGIRSAGKRDTLDNLFSATDAPVLMDWLRQLPLAHYANNCLMVHAGVQPSWDTAQTLEHSQEFSSALTASDWKAFLADLFSNFPDQWHNELSGMARQRVIVNTLTRMRFLHINGAMDFQYKRTLEETPSHLIPWFAHPLRRTADTLVAFGHWSALGLIVHHNLLSLDTGCVWGGHLTAASILPNGQVGDIIQVQNTQPPAKFRKT